MFLANVTHDDIISQEDSLEEYLGNLPDWEKKVDNAKNIVLSKLKNAGKKIRKLNTPLIFINSSDEETITNDGDFTSEKSNDDNVERFLFVFELTALASGSLSIKLQGTDDSEDEVWKDVAIKLTDQVGEFHLRISEPFKYYQLILSGAGSRTFKAYLVEDVFYLPVLFKAISLIYLSLQSEPGSNWSDKYHEYNELFNEAFESLVFSYDKSDDDVIDTSEESSHKQITILR